jgi:hypothetical protein
MKYFKILILALLVAPCYAGPLYKCTVDGIVKYQAAACDGDQKATPLELKLPSEELQEKMRHQQLQRNLEIAEQDLERAKQQKKIDEQNFWKRLEQDRIDSNNRYNQRMKEIEEDSQRRQFETNCALGSRSSECDKYRWEQRFAH